MRVGRPSQRPTKRSSTGRSNRKRYGSFANGGRRKRKKRRRMGERRGRTHTGMGTEWGGGPRVGRESRKSKRLGGGTWVGNGGGRKRGRGMETERMAGMGTPRAEGVPGMYAAQRSASGVLHQHDILFLEPLT